MHIICNNYGILIVMVMISIIILINNCDNAHNDNVNDYY